MTHTEGTSLSTGRLPAGLYPSDCRGELVTIGTFSDRVIVPGADGVFVRDITVFRCVRCEGRISVDLAAGRILNHYQGPRLDSNTVLGLAASDANGEGKGVSDER